MHERDEIPQNENPHAYHFSITYNGFDPLYNSCPPQNANLNDDVSLFVVSFA